MPFRVGLCSQVIIGEDSQRCLGQRVRNFLPRICGNYEIIDTKDYPMPGFDEAFRGRLQNAIFHRVINRMDMHLEQISCHPMEIRRYYHRLDY